MKIKLVTRLGVENKMIGIPNYASELYENFKKQGYDVENLEMGTGIQGFLNRGRIAFSNDECIYHGVLPATGAPLGIGRPGKTVVTFHDPLIPLRFDEGSPYRKYLERFYLNTAKRCERIIAVSEDTKKVISEELGIKKEKITVVYDGVDHDRFKPADENKTYESLRIGYLGGMSEHKNLERLIEAFDRLDTEKDVKLVLGGFGPDIEKLKSKASEKESDIEFKGKIDEEKLPEFYQSLDLFVFPSLLEGFGLPVLEAMACKIPVAISNGSSIPEVAGDAGVYFDPQDTEDMTESISKLVEDESFRREKSVQSLERAQTFSWERTAKETLEVYKSLENEV